MESQFKEKFNSLFGHLSQTGKPVCDDDIRSLMFGDYMKDKSQGRLYDEITSLDDLRVVS